MPLPRVVAEILHIKHLAIYIFIENAPIFMFGEGLGENMGLKYFQFCVYRRLRGTSFELLAATGPRAWLL